MYTTNDENSKTRKWGPFGHQDRGNESTRLPHYCEDTSTCKGMQWRWDWAKNVENRTLISQLVNACPRMSEMDSHKPCVLSAENRCCTEFSRQTVLDGNLVMQAAKQDNDLHLSTGENQALGENQAPQTKRLEITRIIPSQVYISNKNINSPRCQCIMCSIELTSEDYPEECYNPILRCTTLNGANGEFTNTDDMAKIGGSNLPSIKEIYTPQLGKIQQLDSNYNPLHPAPRAIEESNSNNSNLPSKSGIDAGLAQLEGVQLVEQDSGVLKSAYGITEKTKNKKGGESNKPDKMKGLQKELREKEKSFQALLRIVSREDRKKFEGEGKNKNDNKNETKNNEKIEEKKTLHVWISHKNGDYLRDALFQLPGQYDLNPVTQDFLTTWINELKIPYVLHTEPSLLEVENHGVGWAFVNDDPSKNKKQAAMKPASELITLEGCRWKDEKGVIYNMKPRTYLVYTPLFTKLNSNFKSAKLTESIVNAVVVHSTVNEVELPALKDTCEYYLALMARRHYTLIQKSDIQSRIANNAELIASGDFGQWDNFNHDLNLHDRFMPWTTIDSDCQLPLNWPLREDFDILKHHGLHMFNGEFTEEGEAKSRVYKEQGPLQQDEKPYEYLGFTSEVKPNSRHITNFFKFSGLGIPEFIEYGNTANNLKHGLKRLLGAKENENLYRENSMKLSAHFARKMWSFLPDTSQTSIRQVFWELIGGRSKNWHLYGNTKTYINAVFNVGIVSTNNPIRNKLEFFGEEQFDPKTDPLYDQREFIADGLVSLWKKNNRTKITQFLDYWSNFGHWAYYEIYDWCLTHMAALFSRDVIGKIQHVKRKLRARYVNRVLLDDDTNLLVRNLDVLIKRELAKFGKAPRLYVSYDAGCVYANELPEFCKICYDGKHLFQLKEFTLIINIMAKPRKDSLPLIFNDLFEACNSRNYVYVAIFSDDSCMAGNINGRVFCTNVDVVSNDTSQDIAVMLPTYANLSNFHKERALGLIRQLTRPLMIRNPQDPTEFVSIQMHGPVLGSGSLLTTLLNHGGSYAIALSMFYALVTANIDYSTSDEVLEKICIDAAMLIGHSITFDNCAEGSNLNFHHTQFLKRSPFKHKDKWHPYMNLGCILRSFGSVEDNLTAEQIGVSAAVFASLTHEQRINKFCGSIINGWKYEPSNPILRALRDRFKPVSDEVMYHDSLIHVFGVDKEKPIDYSQMDNTEAIMARYHLSSDEIQELADQILSVHVGQHYRSRAMTKILMVDYGVKP